MKVSTSKGPVTIEKSGGIITVSFTDQITYSYQRFSDSDVSTLLSLLESNMKLNGMDVSDLREALNGRIS